MRFTHSFFNFKLNWRRYEFKKKKNKMERGLTNRHVQVMAIAGTIGTGLFFGSRSLYQPNRSFHCTDLYDYWAFMFLMMRRSWGNALPRP